MNKDYQTLNDNIHPIEPLNEYWRTIPTDILQSTLNELIERVNWLTGQLNIARLKQNTQREAAEANRIAEEKRVQELKDKLWEELQQRMQVNPVPPPYQYPGYPYDGYPHVFGSTPTVPR